MSRSLYRQAFWLGVGSLGVSVIWPLFNTFVPLLLAQLGLTATVIGFMMTWDNLANIVAQPIIGRWSDRTRTRWGRRKPWILIGVPLAMVGFSLIPWFETVWGVALALLLTNLGMALFRTPLVALLGDIFAPRQRSQANGLIKLISESGRLSAFVGGGLLYNLAQPLPFLFGGGVLALALISLIGFLSEPELPANPPSAQRSLFRRLNRSLLLILLVIFCWSLGFESLVTWMSSFAVFELGIAPGRTSILLGLSFLGPAILCALPSGYLAGWLGRPLTMTAGFGGIMVMTMGGWYVTTEPQFIALLAGAGAASALVSVNMLPLVYDAGQAAEPGELTGFFYLTLNSAGVIGPQLVGLLIDLSGQNYRMMFPVTAVVMALAGLLMLLIMRSGWLRN